MRYHIKLAAKASCVRDALTIYGALFLPKRHVCCYKFGEIDKASLISMGCVFLVVHKKEGR